MDSGTPSVDVSGRRRFLLVGDQVDQSDWSRSRVKAAQITESKHFDFCMGVLIMVNVALLVVEADSNAQCGVNANEACGPPSIVGTLNHVLLGIYSVEAAVRFYAYRSWFFCVTWNLLDTIIVICGIVDMILSSQYYGLPNLQMFRMFRILRLLRTIRLLIFFPELYELVRGFGSALKAMLWGVVLIALMLGIWSLLMVEIVHPRNSVGHEDEWCNEAFSSVFTSTLFLFQTLVAGDSWGHCTVPIILQSPGVFLLFAGALVSVQLGFTNLILAVIVEAAATARERDHEHRLREKKRHEQEGLERWRAVVQSLDRDDSGSISLEELITGFQTQPAVMKCFDLLDVNQRDLESFFHLMDCDASGDLSYNEFFDCLRKAHSQDIRMYLMSVKLQISQISHVLSKQLQSMTESFRHLSENVGAAPLSAQVHKWQQKHCSSASGLEGAVAESEVASHTTPFLESARCASTVMHAHNHLGAQLELRPEHFPQGADAQVALLAHNTRLLEALLASTSTDGSPVPGGKLRSTALVSSRYGESAVRSALEAPAPSAAQEVWNGPPRGNLGEPEASGSGVRAELPAGQLPAGVRRLPSLLTAAEGAKGFLGHFSV